MLGIAEPGDRDPLEAGGVENDTTYDSNVSTTPHNDAGAADADGGAQADAPYDSADGGTGLDGTASPEGDGPEAGPALPPPGTSVGSVTVSATDETNADTTPFASSSGTVSQITDNDGTVTQMNLTDLADTGTNQERVLNVRLSGMLVPGGSITLDDKSFIEYIDLPGNHDWNSKLAATRAGTVTIDAMNAKSFAFTLHGVVLGPGGDGNAAATGTLTIDGSGQATPW